MGHPRKAGWDTAELLVQADPTTFLLYFALTFAAEADVGAAPIKQDFFYMSRAMVPHIAAACPRPRELQISCVIAHC